MASPSGLAGILFLHISPGRPVPCPSSLVWTETTSFPILTTLLASAAFAVGILLWLQKRVALRLYIAIALGLIVFAAYRFAIEGYTSGRVGMVIGGLLMFAGYSSVSEELPIAGYNHPNRDRGPD